MNKIPTGIPGFDELIQGGFNPNSVNLIAAGPGCGKTLFCMQFLWNGVTKFQENGLFISFEENIEDLRMDALAMGWDFSQYEQHHHVRFSYFHPYELQNVHAQLENLIKTMGAKRVVIDSTSVYGMTLETPFEVRRGLYDLSRILKHQGCVSLLTSEVPEGEGKKLSRFGVEEFLVDSLVTINFESMGGEFSRSLQVRKIRRTKNDEDIHPLEIGPGGLRVHSLQ